MARLTIADRSELQEAYGRNMDLYSSELPSPLPSPNPNSPLRPLTPDTPYTGELPAALVQDGDLARAGETTTN